MKDVPADTPFIFFHWLICVSPLRDFVGGHGHADMLRWTGSPIPCLLCSVLNA